MSATQGSELWLCYRPFADDCDIVRLVDEARAAIVHDTAELALAAGFDRVRVFSTVDLGGFSTERTRPQDLIGDVVAAAASEVNGPVCYAGSGMPAMMTGDWSRVLDALAGGEAVSNRMFSCDWVGVPAGRMLEIVSGEAVDNRFALQVRDHCAVDITQFERSARSLLDVDTPTDLAVLADCAEVGSLEIGPGLAGVLERWKGLLAPAVAWAMEVFQVMTRRDAELFISGRISGSDWAIVDRDTSCRVRLLSEERGLRNRGRRARSILAGLFESTGDADFVSSLSRMGDALIWDTRPFFSHLGWNVSRCDRFWSDVGVAEQIRHPQLRGLVAALAESPVLTGGHSLVSGGMLAGIDAAWTRRELQGSWPPKRRELSG